MVDAYLTDARRHFNFSGRKDYIAAGIAQSNKALQLAKANHLDEKEAWAYISLAVGERANSDFDQALNYNNLAVAIAGNSDDDSLKVMALNSIGITYLRKKDKLLSFRNSLRALEIAEQSGNYFLMRVCYNTLTSFYIELEDFEKAKDYTYKGLKLTFKFNRKLDRLDVYNKLGSVYANAKQFDMAEIFYGKSIALADTLNFELVKLNTYGQMIQMYANNKQAKAALEVFRTRPELMAFMTNAGMDYFLQHIQGISYLELGKFDSAYYFLKRAEVGYAKHANSNDQYWFFASMGDYYARRKDYKKSLEYFLKAKANASLVPDLDLQQDLALNLDSIYQKLGDYKSAYAYNRQYHMFKDSLQKLSTEKDLMLLELDNENRRKERLAQEEEEAKRTRHNIQYMGITAAIAGVFIVLVMLGIFSVSAGTIRILGFFAFIFLFEFIILLADNQIHHWTHGEPWKILAIKIGLISILLPLHHFLEEKVIHYLTSRKMLDLNKSMLSRLSKKEESEDGTEPTLQSSQESSS